MHKNKKNKNSENNFNFLTYHSVNGKFQKYRPYLRSIIIVFYILAFITSLLLLGSFSQLAFTQLNHHCPLYARLSLTSYTHISDLLLASTNVYLDPIQTHWSSPILCQFIVSVAVLNIFNCVFTLSFFLMLTLDGPANDHSLLATTCWLVINLALTLTVLISAFFITTGFIRLCQTVPIDSCRNLQNLKWENKPTWDTGSIYDQLLVASLAGWVLFVLLGIINVALFIRLRCIVEDIKCEVHEHEVLMVRYARILRKRPRTAHSLNDVEKERLDKQKKDNYNLLVSVV